MRILLHSCCGPCSIYPIKSLKEKENEVYTFFFNPNIHPYQEYLQRFETFCKYTEENYIKSIIDDNYELEDWLRQMSHRESQRCQICYAQRLRKTAQIAQKGNFDLFSTTLLVSPFQKHDLIKSLGEAIGEEIGIPFYYEDFRPGFKENVQTSKELGMYRQQYCGCIYSEKDRYAPRKEKRR